MHDPYSLVASVRIPGTAIRLFDVWHCDRGHADGACGWSYPQLSEKQRQAVRDLGWWEGKERHFLRYPFKEYRADVADREVLYRSAVLMVARVIGVRMTFDEAAKMAAEKFGVGGCEGADRMFCFVPGYHSNYPEDRDDDRADVWRQACGSIARQLLRQRRKWWQHPRWHIHHWKIFIPALVRLSPRLNPLR